MDREYTYSKPRLLYVLERILEQDILADPAYAAADRAAEGFEKRAVLEFVSWFLEQAFPDDFAFACTFERLEDDYPEPLARLIAEAEDWSPPADVSPEGRLIEVDFRAPRRGRRNDGPDEPDGRD